MEGEAFSSGAGLLSNFSFNTLPVYIFGVIIVKNTDNVKRDIVKSVCFRKATNVYFQHY